MSPEDDPQIDAPAQAEGRGFARWLVRGAFLLAAGAALWPGWDRPALAALVPAASPLVAFSALAATWTLEAVGWLGLAVAAIALVRRRWFCRWVCPTGLCADAAGRLGRRAGLRCPRLPVLGQWIALVTLAGACLGYPLLAWLDPLAMFAGLFAPFGPRLGPVVWWSAVGVPAVLAISLWMPGAWCGRVCPLGGMQDLLAGVTGAVRRRLAGVKDRAPAEPDGWHALQGRGSDLPVTTPFASLRACHSPGWRMARRAVLGAAIGGVWAAMVRAARAAAPRPLRPPGARPEPEFTGLCIRCGNCIRVCPTAILAPDPGGHGLAGLLAPVLRFESDYCREDCTRCTAACPSGALVRLTADSKRLGAIGLPKVDMGVCLLGDDRECFVCRNSCPYEAIRLVFSEVEYTLTPQVDAGKCPGCGACEVACPTTPVKAIVVAPQ